MALIALSAKRQSYGLPAEYDAVRDPSHSDPLHLQGYTSRQRYKYDAGELYYITPTAVSRCLEEHFPTARKRSRPVDDGLAACRLDGFVTTLIHTGGFEAVWTALNQSGQL